MRIHSYRNVHTLIQECVVNQQHVHPEHHAFKFNPLDAFSQVQWEDTSSTHHNSERHTMTCILSSIPKPLALWHHDNICQFEFPIHETLPLMKSQTWALNSTSLNSLYDMIIAHDPIAWHKHCEHDQTRAVFIVSTRLSPPLNHQLSVCDCYKTNNRFLIEQCHLISTCQTQHPGCRRGKATSFIFNHLHTFSQIQCEDTSSTHNGSMITWKSS